MVSSLPAATRSNTVPRQFSQRVTMISLPGPRPYTVDGTASLCATLQTKYHRLFRLERPYVSSRIAEMGNAVQRAFILPPSYALSAPLFLLSNSPYLQSYQELWSQLSRCRSSSSAHSGGIMAMETYHFQFLIVVRVFSLFKRVLPSIVGFSPPKTKAGSLG